MFLTVVLVKAKNGMLTFRRSTDRTFYPIVRAKLRQPELKRLSVFIQFYIPLINESEVITGKSHTGVNNLFIIWPI